MLTSLCRDSQISVKAVILGDQAHGPVDVDITLPRFPNFCQSRDFRRSGTRSGLPMRRKVTNLPSPVTISSFPYHPRHRPSTSGKHEADLWCLRLWEPAL